MALPNESELVAISQFRERVNDLLRPEDLKDDMFLLRWIRAREMDLQKAEGMLRNAIEWRRNNKVDLLLDQTIDPFFITEFPRWTDGLDKEGRPIYTAWVGHWDVRKVGNQSADFLNYTTEGFERLMKGIKSSDLNAQGKGQARVTQFLATFDFDGFPWAQLLNFRAVQNLLSLGSIYEAYYPEILHSAIFINSPYFISKVLLLLKPILSTKTYQKLKVFGSREEWEPYVLEHVHPEQIRPQFGGTKQDISKNLKQIEQ